MTPAELSLEITRLKIRCEIHEALLAQLMLGSRLAIPGTSTQEARAQTLSVFEAVAEGLGGTFFGSEQLSGSDGSEKALYREELRDIVDHMKSYVDLLTKSRP
jgi:hypothetical protein